MSSSRFQNQSLTRFMES